MVNACFCRFNFFHTKSRDWLGEASPKLHILCRVGCKTATRSINQLLVVLHHEYDLMGWVIYSYLASTNSRSKSRSESWSASRSGSDPNFDPDLDLDQNSGPNTWHFLPVLCYVSADTSYGCVCLSQVGVLSKRLNESGWFLAQVLSALCYKEIQVPEEI